MNTDNIEIEINPDYTMHKVRENGINLSNEDDVINLINRKSYKTSEDLIEDENIFNHNVEKFIISSIHGNDLYKIYNY